MTELIIGSRGSQLALWQAHWVKARLEELGHSCRIEIIKTTGDRVTELALPDTGTKGLFTKEIEEGLLERRVDLAVHSLKDLPTELPDPSLRLSAIPAREDPLDAMVGKRLSELPQGARVGTSSPRRAAQLRYARPDLNVESVRGNVDTRLRKLDEGQYAAIVLASAGLRRLGWASRIAESFAPEVMCPAVGQGALAIETLSDGAGAAACAALDHAETRVAVEAERAVLGALGGGCKVPIGAYARVEQGTLRIMAVVISPDGVTLIRDFVDGPVMKASFGEASMGDAEALGRRLAARLLERGAGEILNRL